MNGSSLRAENLRRWAVGIVIALLVAAILGVGGWLAMRLYDQARDLAVDNLRAVSVLKLRELASWATAKKWEYSFPRDNTSAILVDRWLAAGGTNAAQTRVLAERLEMIRASRPDSQAIWLHGPDGSLLLAGKEASRHPDDLRWVLFNLAATEGGAVLGDLHLPWSGGETGPTIEVVSPLLLADKDMPGGSRLVGYIVQQIDPQKELFSIVKDWPLPSASAESVLFRVESDDIVYLSPMRHLATLPSAGMRLPMPENPSLLATQAVTYKRTLVSGPDYRGVQAVGIVAPVPGVGWHLLTKIDRAEMLAAAQRDAVVVASTTLVLLATLGLVIGVALRAGRARQRAALAEGELARHEAEARFELLTRYAKDIVLLFDHVSSRIVDANEAAVAAYGYSQEELLALPRGALGISGADADADDTADVRESTYETTHRRKNGTTFPVEVSSRVIEYQGAHYRHDVVRDIAERKVVEARLRESEDRFRTIFDAIDAAILVRDPHSLEYVATNRSVELLFGYSVVELAALPLGTLFVDNDAAQFRSWREQALAGVPVLFERQMRRRDGRLFWAEVSLHVATIGARHCYIIVVRDISKRKTTEALLLESEDRFRTIFDSIGSGIFIRDAASFATVATNEAVEHLFGYSKEEIATLPSGDLWMNVDQAQGREHIRQARAGVPQRFEWLGRHRDGRTFWAEVNVHCATIGARECLVAVMNDISERKAHEQALRDNLEAQTRLNHQLEDAQNQLLQSEKMAAIGQLAAGVAHEINNPVGFVSSNFVSLSSYLDDIFAIVDAYETAVRDNDPQALARVEALREAKEYTFLRQDVRQLLAESTEGLMRVRKIVQDLRDFSRVGETEWQWADLRQGLDSTLNIVWHELKYHCTVTKNYSELPQIYCLPSQLNQVFMNLLVNAGQAIEGRGEITIACGCEGDESVWVSITDSGKGIAPEYLGRIFDPFFTTKPVGKGTGLGLSLVYGIIKRHDGRIVVDSTVGKGSTFKVILPIHSVVAAEKEASA